MIYEQLKGMIATQLKVSESKVTLDARLQEDLKADSANVMMLIMDIEQEYNITVDDSLLADVRTVGDIVKYLEANV